MRYVGLDLSTKTGVCILSPSGEVLYEEEFVYKNITTPDDMLLLIFDVMDCISEKDVVVIEGFGYASKTGFLLGGIGWAIRMELSKRNIPFYVVAPTALKKYATGSGKADKRKVAVEVNKRWGFYSDSDNITDAYVLAQIGRGLKGEYEPIKVQQEVLKKIK
ncbi:crossover junction endodeoxyribonuclease RuvC [Pseudobacillus sp. FSL P4-0506]|uniref:crossover junction endodeoxyribonuclease RuvC n=1 Tax=Pseudobacillus sp. FSL P4-0506 TaxID=2921576 RepID=UPI0030FB05F6